MNYLNTKFTQEDGTRVGEHFTYKLKKFKNLWNIPPNYIIYNIGNDVIIFCERIK